MSKLNPKWAHQVVYQIFPERFAIGGGLSSDTKLAHPAYSQPGNIKRHWHESPCVQPWSNVFYGGDLDGIREHCDYIQQLGATTVYLTPIFDSPSNHKYDARDYLRIDPMFGDESSLRQLIKTLHQADMRLMLDAVINHCSEQHAWFVQAQAGAADMKSRFRWSEQGYGCWRDYGHMPELNLDHPDVCDAMYRRPESFVQKYLGLGIDGWRFDVAADIGLHRLADLRAKVSQLYPQAELIGEVMAFPEIWLHPEQGYHGVMNYYFRDAVLGALTQRMNVRELHQALSDLRRYLPLPALLHSWNMLASHDTPRLKTLLRGDITAIKLAYFVQMTFAGVPFIYYGEENGMEGGADPDCRRPMVWDSSAWDMSIREWVHMLIQARQTHRALWAGDVRMVADGLDEHVLMYVRHTEVAEEFALAVANMGPHTYQRRAMIPYSRFYHDLPLKNLLPPYDVLHSSAGSLEIKLPSGACAIYVPQEPFKRYQFFKPVPKDEENADS